MDRKGYIGGSDLYSILNGNWNELWQVKTGRKEPDDLSGQFNVALGTETEAFNINWLHQQTGWYSHTPKPKRKVISGVPYQARPDGIAMHDEHGGHAIVECKHTSSYKDMNNIISMYLPQVHLYMRVFELNKAVFSVIFGNKWDCIEVDYDHEFWMKVSTQAFQFWQMVEADIEPTKDYGEPIDWTKIAINGLVARDASDDNYFMDLAHRFVNGSQAARDHEQLKKELRSMINDNEREVFCDLLTIKRDKRGSCRITIKEGAA